MALKQLSPPQFLGFFDSKIRMKVSLEEWFQSEIDYQSQRYENFIKIRVYLVDAIFQRPNSTIAGFWYELSNDFVWLFISTPVLKKLDFHLCSILSRLMVDTIHLFTQKKTFPSFSEAEKEAFKLYVGDMDNIRSSKGLNHAERLKQVVFLLLNQYYREHLPVVFPANIIPKSDSLLQEKLQSSFSRIKNSLYDYQKKQTIGDIKLRMMPYLFQDINHDQTSAVKNPLRLKLALSFISKNEQGNILFSIIIFTSQFVELLDRQSMLLDYILAYEIMSIENSLKFNRGLMEQEIRSIVSKDTDSAEHALYSLFGKETIDRSKKEIENSINNLIEENIGFIRIVE